jgi:hypothetical protein
MISKAMSKESLRVAIREEISRVPRSLFSAAGHAVAAHLGSWLIRNQGLLPNKRIAMFKSLSDEIDINPIIEALKSLDFDLYLLPQKGTPNSCLKMLVAKFGIPALMLVPGRAFDLMETV